MDNDNAVDNGSDINTAIRQVFGLDRWSGVLDTGRTETWANSVWQQWAVAGHVPTDLDAGPDHADLIALLGALALLHQDFTDEDDEFGHDLTGSWPLASAQQLAHYCGRHEVDVESALPDFAMDDAVAHHALPLALYLMSLTASRDEVFAQLLSLEASNEHSAEEIRERAMNAPSFEGLRRHERFAQLWEPGEHIDCPACAHSLARQESPSGQG